ncbi:MAG: tetratricopeptide repeat protein [Clostridiales Family XIII bacterium]|nr:tetratricopeptide repeat protein [Clostridiales Family XIII bacterium]
MSIKVRQGFAYFKIGKYNEAQNLYQQVSSGDPKLFQQANYYSGVISLKENKSKEALQYLEKAWKVGGEDDIQAKTTLCCAEINYNLGDLDTAKKLIKDFKKFFPSNELSEKIDDLQFRISIDEKDYASIIEGLGSVEEKTEFQKELLQKALLFEGNEFLNQDKYEEARKRYEKSLDEGISFKYNNHAYLGLGECYTYTKDFNRALEEYQNVDRSSDKYPYALLGISYIHFNSQKYDAAQKNFTKILKSYQNKFDKKTISDIQNRLGDCFFIKKQYSNALKQYRINNDDHCHFYLGVIFNISNNYAQALSYFKKINPDSTYHERALLEMGTIHLSHGQPSKATEIFSQLLEKYPDSEFLGPVLLKRATANVGLKNFSKAQVDYITFLDNFPGDPNYSNVLSNLLDITKDETLRQEYISRFKNKIKNLSSLSFNDGKNCFYEKEYSRAIEILGTFVSKNKNDKNFDEACYLLAESYRFTKNIDESVKLYSLLANEEKSDFFIKSLIKLGSLYRSRGDHENAIKYFEKLKEKSKGNRDRFMALNGLMNENFSLRNFEKAARDANEYLKLNPENIIDANLMICKCNFELKKFSQALEKCKSSLKDKRFNEVKDEFLFIKAKSLYEIKKYNDSLKVLFDLTKTYQNSKWFDESYIWIAKNYIAQNKIPQAHKTLDSIIKNSTNEELKEKARSLKEKNSSLSN